METTHVLSELQALGSEQTRKTLGRHGAKEPLYGVKYSDLGKLTKRIKRDHALALTLWRSGIHDARILATMIADPAQVDEALAQSMLGDSADYVVGAALATLLAQCAPPLVELLIRRWTAAGDELTGHAGWSLVSAVAAQADSRWEATLTALLPRIEREIHAAPNRARQAMNRALIAIGSRSDTLADTAITAASRIGKVDVDMGDTACEIPDAAAYIRKSRAQQSARAAKTKTPTKRS